MFFLGHFTGGLFGGMRDTMSISNDWETLKQKRLETRHIERMAQGAELTADALRQQQRALSVDKGAQQAAADAEAPYGRGGEHSPARQSKSYTDADLEEIPAPTWQQKLKTALKSAADRTSPREGKAFGGVTDSSSAIPAIPKPGQQPTYGSKVDNLDPYSPDFDTGVFNKASGVSSTPTAAKLATPAAASGTPAPQQPSQAIPTPRTEPPRYLLDGTPAGPPGSTPPVQGGPAAPAAATGPMSALPYAQPTLANNMTGLGPRILAALNPTAGSTA